MMAVIGLSLLDDIGDRRTGDFLVSGGMDEVEARKILGMSGCISVAARRRAR
jgi:hypothetical protein